MLEDEYFVYFRGEDEGEIHMGFRNAVGHAHFLINSGNRERIGRMYREDAQTWSLPIHAGAVLIKKVGVNK